jgi:hypothetical protein
MLLSLSLSLLQELGDLGVDHHVQQVGPSGVQGALEGRQEVPVPLHPEHRRLLWAQYVAEID